MTLGQARPKIREPSSPAELELTDADFQTISKIAYTDFGLYLQPSKKALVFSRLARRVRDLGLPDFASYVSHVTDANSTGEKSKMLSALTTNVTQFFREKHHFDQLETEVFPGLIKLARSGAKVRLWSAACSAGQEPYSLAASLIGLCPDAGRLDIKILATDIDPAILEKARAGRYPSEERAAIPQKLREIATQPVSGSPGEFEITPSVRQLVTFNSVNLIADWPMKGAFDVILCRNVAIYFDKETQARLWQRLNVILKPGGYLMIGHSERLSDAQNKDFSSVGITAYRKTLNAPAAQLDRNSKEDRK